MRRYMRAVIAIILLISMAFSGCKKDNENDSKEIDNISTEKIIEQADKREDIDKNSGDLASTGSQIGGLHHCLR